ncbi:PHP domain-containing protein [Nanoarchaeota archaeon]
MVSIITDPGVFKGHKLVDMHHHSTVSDGAKTPGELAKIFKKRGMGLCLTDHNQISGALYLDRQKDVFSIPGIEITTQELKDVLAYFYHANDLKAFWEKEVKQKIENKGFMFNMNSTSIPIADLPEKVRAYNGITVLAHPFVLNPKASHHLLDDQEFMKKIDAVEMFNYERRTKKELDQMQKTGKPLTAGSDSHHISAGTILTVSKAADREEFLKSVLQKKHMIYHGGYPYHRVMRERWTIFRNNLRSPLK